MTFIYIVREECSPDIEGVFSSVEKAQAYIDSFPKEQRNWYDIYPYELK